MSERARIGIVIPCYNHGEFSPETVASVVSAGRDDVELIVDDYGYWRGARRAVDEFLDTNDTPLFLSRVDHTGRIAIRC